MLAAPAVTTVGCVSAIAPANSAQSGGDGGAMQTRARSRASWVVSFVHAPARAQLRPRPQAATRTSKRHQRLNAVNSSGANNADAHRDAAEKALASARAAAEKAKLAVDRVETLPGATWASFAAGERRRLIGTKVTLLLRPVGLALAVVAVFSTIAYIPTLSLTARAAGASLVALLIAVRGYSKRSLDGRGAVAAAVVGAANLFAGARFGATLMAFYYSGSALTRLGAERKAALEDGVKDGAGERDWRQVGANALAPTLAALALCGLSGWSGAAPLAPLSHTHRPLVAMLSASYLGYLGCCTGDTWASELGKLAQGEPRLITTWRKVRPGVNGAVTLAGTAASLAGGALVGAVFALGSWPGTAPSVVWPILMGRAVAIAPIDWRLMALGAASGMLGSIIDSLLGATLQFTGYDTTRQKVTGTPGEGVLRISGVALLSNDGVNLVSAVITAALAAAAATWLF